MELHKNHRERVKKRFLEEGIDSFAPHQAMELLLFYGVARQDVNELGHRLIHAFGGFSAACDAPLPELLQIEGVGEHTAVLLKLIPELARYYATDKNRDVCLNSTKAAGEFMISRFIGRNDEHVYMVSLDNKCKVLATTLLHEGSVNAAEINLRKLLATALKYNASGVILAHNHPGGVALPSPEDIATTARVAQSLHAVGIALIDHIIVADLDFVSLADSGSVPRW